MIVPPERAGERSALDCRPLDELLDDQSSSSIHKGQATATTLMTSSPDGLRILVSLELYLIGCHQQQPSMSLSSMSQLCRFRGSLLLFASERARPTRAHSRELSSLACKSLAQPTANMLGVARAEAQSGQRHPADIRQQPAAGSLQSAICIDIAACWPSPICDRLGLVGRHFL